MEVGHLLSPPLKNADGSAIKGKGWLIDYLCIMYTPPTSKLQSKENGNQ